MFKLITNGPITVDSGASPNYVVSGELIASAGFNASDLQVGYGIFNSEGNLYEVTAVNATDDFASTFSVGITEITNSVTTPTGTPTTASQSFVYDPGDFRGIPEVFFNVASSANADILAAIATYNAQVDKFISELPVLEDYTELSSYSGDSDVLLIKANGIGGTFVKDATATTVDGGLVPTSGWRRDFSGSVDPAWWGAVEGESEDNTVAIQKALESGYPVDLGGLTYRVASIVSYMGDVSMQNGTLVLSGIATAINITGSEADVYTNGADPILPSARTITATGVAVNDYIRLYSSDVFHPDNANYANDEFFQVTKVVGTDVTLDSPVVGNYASGYTVAVVNLSDVTLNDLNVIGESGALPQSLVGLTRSRGSVKSCEFVGGSSVSLGIGNCGYLTLTDVTALQTDTAFPTTSYGAVVINCSFIKFLGGTYYGDRHGLATGGSGINKYIEVIGATVGGQTGGVPAMDFHENTAYSTVSNCTLTDGVNFQGGKNLTLKNCEVYNEDWRLFYANNLIGDLTIKNNSFVSKNGTDQGIFVSFEGGFTGKVVFKDNEVVAEGGSGEIARFTMPDTSNLFISGNTFTAVASTKEVRVIGGMKAVISDNRFESMELDIRTGDYDLQIMRNVFTSTTSDVRRSLYLDSGTTGVGTIFIAGNVWEDMIGSAIYLRNADTVTLQGNSFGNITANSFSGSLQSNVFIQGVTDLFLIDNYFSDTDITLYASVALSTVTNMTRAKNTFLTSYSQYRTVSGSSTNTNISPEFGYVGVFGSESVTTDASGDATITHTLGEVPTYIQVTLQGNLGRYGTPYTLNSTTFKVRAFNGDGTTAVSTPIILSWEIKA
jgi:hypothetical protein